LEDGYFSEIIFQAWRGGRRKIDALEDVEFGHKGKARNAQALTILVAENP
jgi:hypothetical protein